MCDLIIRIVARVLIESILLLINLFCCLLYNIFIIVHGGDGDIDDDIGSSMAIELNGKERKRK